MKAIVCNQYGPPKEVLQLEEVGKPDPREGEVLLKIYAASLNAADLEYIRGMPLVRMGGPFRPRFRIPGSDVAGRVESVGINVKQVQPGDEVLVDLSVCGFGAFAEYVTVPEKELALKPERMTFEEAAALPQAGIIALQSLRDKREIRPGQKVLINGAGGGMGTFAVQIAKSYGAEVTAVDSKSKLEKLQSIGADWVVDFNQEDYTELGRRYDLILDVAAYRSAFDYRRALSTEGICVVVGGSTATIFQSVLLGFLTSRVERKQIGINRWKPNNKEDLMYLGELFDSGQVRPIIDRRYPLREIPEALRYLDEEPHFGKIVIPIARD